MKIISSIIIAVVIGSSFTVFAEDTAQKYAASSLELDEGGADQFLDSVKRGIDKLKEIFGRGAGQLPDCDTVRRIFESPAGLAERQKEFGYSNKVINELLKCF